MPYATINDLPEHVKKVKSKKRQRMWLAVWNSVYRKTGSESRAFAAANSKLKEFKIMTYREIKELIGHYIKGTKKGPYDKKKDLED
jgi:cation transport regulator ChaB